MQQGTRSPSADWFPASPVSLSPEAGFQFYGRPATADEEAHLRLRPGIWVLDVWHTSYDRDNVPYELTRFVMRADMTGLDFTIHVS